MSRWEAWSFHILTILLSVTGALLFWMKYILRTEDPFSVINHPWQPAMLTTHVLAAPLFILAFGMMIQSHIARKLRGKNSRATRYSGVVSLGSCLVLMISGYLLQVTTGPTLARVLLILHLATGTLFAAVYLTHQFAGYQRLREHLRAQPGRGLKPLTIDD